MRNFSYESAVAYIHATYGQGKKNGLANMRLLLEKLGNPQDRFPSMHVAGTNGKGSVCAFLHAALRCAGYRTGLYTSPFLQRYNERMRVDGAPIPDGTLARLMNRVADAVDALRESGVLPTEFEIGTALAFLFFAEEHVDIAVIEVGLGGRLDPTNVITPRVSVIASIGLDHMSVLGDTPELIAAEKAGIAKPGVPLVLSAQATAAVRKVVQDRCAEVGAPFSLAEPLENAPLGLPGAHQRYNASVAAAALRRLQEGGWRIGEPAILEGMRRARWPGRLEWVPGAPPLLLDGAHNPQGVLSLASYVKSLPKRRLVLLTGIMKDKDWQEMVGVFAPIADAVVTVTPDNKRALGAETLADAFSKTGVEAVSAASPAEAVAAAKALAGAEGVVVCAGSLYLIGELRTLVVGQGSALLAE